MILAIFDFDGTICDTKDSILNITDLTYKSLNKNISKDLIKDTLKLGCSLEKTFSKINTSLNLDFDIDFLVKIYRNLYNNNGYKYINVYEGITALLDFLKKKDVTILVLSNKGSESIEKILKYNKIDRYIDEVIGADSCKYNKPNPKLISEVISAKYPNIEKEKTFIIGDTLTDIKFAKNCSLKSCFVSYGYGDTNECIQLQPDIVIHNPKELFKIKGLF
ncbi:HAD family hydrolase [Francisella salimarina]|uniref:HAD family hydrolase n=1 Tax=Francisella salimarina TaxID=2599927 RepID=UPI003753E2E0